MRRAYVRPTAVCSSAVYLPPLPGKGGKNTVSVLIRNSSKGIRCISKPTEPTLWNPITGRSAPRELGRRPATELSVSVIPGKS